jgi:hypothetical protein
LGIPAVYSEESIRSLRDKLAANEVSGRPPFLDASSGEQEDVLRAQIAAAEYDGNRDNLPGRFAELCRLKSRQMRPWRLRDLACELVCLTEGGRSEELRLEAIAHRGFANLLLGHWKGAAASGLNEMALEFVLDAQAQAVEGREVPGASEGLTLLAELMHRKSRPDNAAQLMQRALESTNLLADNDAMIRAFAFLAYCHLRTGDFDKALIHATQCEEHSRSAPYSRWMLLATYVAVQFRSLVGPGAVHRFVEIYDAIADHDDFEPAYTQCKQLLGATGRQGAGGM